MDAATDVEIQRHFNELRRELLDHRVKLADRWLTATAGFLTFFGLVALIIGYLGFQELSNIETKAEGHMKIAKEHAEEAERLVNQIRVKHAELEELDAESIGKNLPAALRAAEDVQEDPAAPLIDRAIAAAVQLQGQEKIEAAIEMWRYIANVAEGVDSQLQARAWFSIGYLYWEEDNREAAIDAYDKVIELEPDAADAYTNRGNAKSALGQHEAALADYDKAIELEPDDAIAYSNRGITKHDLGQYEAALADYDKAIELEPDTASAYTNRGITKRALGQHEAALADYDKAIELEPDDAAAYNNRGSAKSDLGRLNEAREDFQKALALAQESGDEDLIAKAKRNLSRLGNDQAP